MTSDGEARLTPGSVSVRISVSNQFMRYSAAIVVHESRRWPRYENAQATIDAGKGNRIFVELCQAPTPIRSYHALVSLLNIVVSASIFLASASVIELRLEPVRSISAHPRSLLSAPLPSRRVDRRVIAIEDETTDYPSKMYRSNVAFNPREVVAMRSVMQIVLLVLVGAWGAPQALAQQIQCSNPLGQVFSVAADPAFPGLMVVRPVNFAGVLVVVAPVAHPIVAYANVDWAGNGTLLTRNGQLVGVWYGRATPIANCAAMSIIAPLPPSYPAPPPVIVSGGVPPVGQQIAVRDPSSGRDTTFAQPDGALPMLASEQAAIGCWRDSVGNQDAFLGCIVDAMTNDTQRTLLHCVRDSNGATEGGACLARTIDPRAGQIADTLTDCGATSGSTDWDCIARKSLDGRLLSAYRCVADDMIDASACLDALGADDRTKRAALIVQKCYDSGSDASDYALCALEGSGNRDVARAASCVKQEAQSADPSYLGAGLCFAAGSLRLNPEQQIAVECAVSTGGQPYAFAACAGGRLTSRELTKCFTSGVGGNGCFGPNNEIVKALSVAGIDVGNLGNPNGEVIKAWNTVSNDLRNGVGRNNDGVRLMNRAQTLVTTTLNNARHDLQHGAGPNNEIVKFANNAARDLQHGPGPNNEIRKAVCGLFRC